MSHALIGKTGRSAGKMSLSRRGWVLLFSVSLLLNFGLGLGVVWVNAQRTHMGYRLEDLDKERHSLRQEVEKLAVERDSLVGRDALQRKAGKMGLGTARPGQVRRITEVKD